MVMAQKMNYKAASILV